VRGEAAASHACIVASPSQEAARAEAVRMAAAMLCTGEGDKPCGTCRSCRLVNGGIHPDVSFISRPLDDKGKQKREIYVDQIRRMAADAWILPQEADRKVYIITEAHKMNIQAQNAALKILEEPPEWVRFILCADNAEELLPTVRSRCTLVRVEEKGKNAATSPEAEQFLKLATEGRRDELCAFWVGLESLDSQGLTELLESVEALISAKLLDGKSGGEISPRELNRLLELCRRVLEYLRLNVSVKHVLGLMNVLSAEK